MVECKCKNCKHTKKHGGHMVCLTKLDRAIRHDDVPAPRSRLDKLATIFLMAVVAVILCLMFLGLLAVCLT